MGQSTEVINRRPRRIINRKRPARLQIDVPLVLILITLVAFGLLMMYSASWDASMQVTDNDSPTYLFFRQLMWLGVGIIGLVFMLWMDYHHWNRLAIAAMGTSLLGLLAVLIYGETIDDTTRGFFEGSYQPSEVAKLVIVIYLAVWLFAKRDQLEDKNFGLIPLSAIIGITGGLILSQPDLSAAAVVFLMGGLMFFLAGSAPMQTGLLLSFATGIGYLVLHFNPTKNTRITDFLVGWKSVAGSNWHVQKALIAFSRGEWFGVGIGRGVTKLTSLPFPHTDSVFAVVAEETGVFGASIVVVLFLLLLWRGLVIAMNAPDGLGSLLAAGLPLWIVLEAFINMASLMGLIPFAGNTLPFFSLGGSNLVMSLAAIGIVLNISRLSEQKKEEKRRAFGAIVDLRRRNRRRSVSRARRS
ncbi:MAG: cell division protein FtsW [Chloroflexi bacterium]|nr:cell division protein FtsW [Chloroflexota bacterium]